MSHLRLVQDHAPLAFSQMAAQTAAQQSEKSPTAIDEIRIEGDTRVLHSVQSLLNLVAPPKSALGSLVSASGCKQVADSSGLTLTVDRDSHAAGGWAVNQKVSCYIIQGLRGVLAGPNSDVSVKLIGVSADANLSELTRAIRIATPTHSHSRVAVDRCISGAEDFALHGTCEKAELVSAFSLISDFETKKITSNVIVVPEALIDQLAETVSRLAGTEPLRVKLSIDTKQVSVSWHPEANSGDVAPGASPDESVVVVAVVRLLQGLGQMATAQRLFAAWVSTLESGYHTAAIRHIAPYTWQLNGRDFMGKVAESFKSNDSVQQHSGTKPKTQLSLVC